jgi:hypothetical protein
LIPKEAMTKAAAYRWHRRQTRFFFNYVKIFLLFISVLILSPFVISLSVIPIAIVGAGAGVQVAGWITVVAIFVSQGLIWVVFSWLLGRLSMLFLATAVDNHMSILEAW